MADQQSLYTLAQASELTGLSTEALRLRIKRGKLAAERGNDGQPRVRITDAEREDFARLLVRRQPTLSRQTSTLTRQDVEKTNVIKVLEDAVGILREQLGRAEAATAAERVRVERAEAEREAARIAAAVAEGEAKTLRVQVQVARDEAAARVQAAETARDDARAELADWTAGGPLGRAWRALIYRRGRP
jgi:hypothetical protein